MCTRVFKCVFVCTAVVMLHCTVEKAEPGFQLFWNCTFLLEPLSFATTDKPFLSEWVGCVCFRQVCRPVHGLRHQRTLVRFRNDHNHRLLVGNRMQTVVSCVKVTLFIDPSLPPWPLTQHLSTQEVFQPSISLMEEICPHFNQSVIKPILAFQVYFLPYQFYDHTLYTQICDQRMGETFPDIPSTDFAYGTDSKKEAKDLKTHFIIC